jgi:putative acetyltransferase
MTEIAIRAGGLDDPRVAALVLAHRAASRAVTPPGSAHALDLAGLQGPGIEFFSAWLGAAPVGTGALKRLDAGHGEIKTMFTTPEARGRGVAAAMLRHLLGRAAVQGLARISLETGGIDYFAPARALYARHGFVVCAAFAPYLPDPNSVFMTLALAAPCATESGQGRGLY